MRHPDRINRKLVGLIKGRSISINPALKSSRLLRCCFIGSTLWPHGYWNHHYGTNYLDVQIVESGILILRSESGSIRIPAGSTVLIPPGEFTLEAGSAEGVRKKHFGIAGSLCLQNLGILGLDKIILLPNCPDAELQEELDLLYRQAEQEYVDSSMIHAFTAQLSKLIIMFAERAENRNLPQTLITAKSFIECAFFNNNLTMKEISHHAGCSKILLQKQFRQYLNITPIQYLTQVRMKYAEQLLKEQKHTIKIIAGMCGYNNPLYFSNVFKKYSGCYPREYRLACEKNSHSAD